MSRVKNRPQPHASTRGRPRSEAVEQAILEGALQFLENGVPLSDLSIERIARTAGVGKATVYRRWSGKEELFIDVIRATEPGEPELPGTSMRDDLVALLDPLRRCRLVSSWSAMRDSPRVWAAYQAAVINPCRSLGLEILRRGRANGELSADIDLELVIDMFIGPLLVNSFLRREVRLPDGAAGQIVDGILDGLRPVGFPGT
ncbi:TetR/AcrR family transcriptional regulator [Streptomyces sp. NPDC020951]|uniref:TetR/AcrR family transcriptional regulator n=1 Tax=Streptomyces sp. NPDC020951 TaxID=3365104 RepID=UPI0037A70783